MLLEAGAGSGVTVLPLVPRLKAYADGFTSLLVLRPLIGSNVHCDRPALGAATRTASNAGAEEGAGAPAAAPAVSVAAC